jgi:hypothetical protein
MEMFMFCFFSERHFVFDLMIVFSCWRHYWAILMMGLVPGFTSLSERMGWETEHSLRMNT